MGPRYLSVAVLVVLALAATGCGGRAVTRESLVATGHNPMYADGFMHGYASGRAMNGGIGDRWCKLADPYTVNTYYHQGWDEGYAFGTSEMQRAKEAFARSSADYQRVQQQRQDDFQRINREREDQLMREQIDEMYKEQHALPRQPLTPVLVHPAFPPPLQVPR